MFLNVEVRKVNGFYDFEGFLIEQIKKLRNVYSKFADILSNANF